MNSTAEPPVIVTPAARRLALFLKIGGLGAPYGYLYFVLKSQDYALVAGTAALFAALALVMFCTRRINWYDLELSRTANAEPAD